MRVTVRERVLPSRKRQVYFDLYYAPGRRKAKAFGLLPKDPDARREMREAALAIAAKMQLQYKADSYGIPLDNGSEKSLPGYIRQIIASTEKPNTRTAWDFSLKALEKFSADVSFGQVNKDFLERFAKHLLSEYAHSTARLVMAKIRTAMRKAHADGLLQSLPGTVTIKKPSRHPVFLEIEDVRKLDSTECSNPNVKNAFLFCCFSGLRWGDVSALTWDQVEGAYLTFRQEKTEEIERVPLSATARAILDRQRNATPSPWTRTEQKPGRVFLLPTREGARDLLKRWAKAAGITKTISWHVSRHSFAVSSISAGNDLYVTGKLLGHRSLSSTQVYAKVVDARKQEAVDKMPGL